jgi:hypothetical protein
MLELSTVAVDILVDQRAIAAANMLVRRTSKIRAVNAECSKPISLNGCRWASKLGPDQSTRNKA